MATTEEKRSKRTAARERLRVEFLSQTGSKLAEFHALLSDNAGDEEALESLAHGLARLADTASSLELAEVAAAATEAATDVREGRDGVPRLRALVRAVRGATTRPLFGKVIIVSHGGQLEALERDAQTVTEPVQLVPTLDDLPAAVDHHLPAVVTVPASALSRIGSLIHDDGFSVVVYGDERDWAQRLKAVEVGARGFLADPFRLADLLELARWYKVEEDQSTPEVFVLAEAGPERSELLEALEAAGMSTMASARPAEIAPALDAVCPDAMVFGARVGDADAATLINAVRRHPEGGFVPIVVTGSDWPEPLLAAGADDVLPEGVTTPSLVARVQLRIARFASIRRDRDPVTSLPNRIGALRLLDRHLVNARRRGTTLAACLVQIDNLEPLQQRYGKTAINAAQRALADALEGGVRRIDVVGQIDPATFVAALPQCRAYEAARRMSEIQKRFLWRCRSDARLKDLNFNVGVADSDPGIPTLIVRAEAALLQSKAANG